MGFGQALGRLMSVVGARLQKGRSIPLCPRFYLEWVILGMLMLDADLTPRWAIPPNVHLGPADRRKYGKADFVVVKISLHPPHPTREEAWDLVRRTFSKVYNAGLLRGILGMKVQYNVWDGGPLGKDVLSVWGETEVIPHLLKLSVGDLPKRDESRRSQCTWTEDVLKSILGKDAKRT